MAADAGMAPRRIVRRPGSQPQCPFVATDPASAGQNRHGLNARHLHLMAARPTQMGTLKMSSRTPVAPKNGGCCNARLAREPLLALATDHLRGHNPKRYRANFEHGTGHADAQQLTVLCNAAGRPTIGLWHTRISVQHSGSGLMDPGGR